MKVHCPTCLGSTHTVQAITLRALLTPMALERAGDCEGFYFCPSDRCDTVYWRGSDDCVLASDAIAVAVYQKSQDPRRLVCYCFHHSVTEVAQSAKDGRDTKLVESITAKCRAGEDRCATTNPQGRCCLGNVRAVVRQARPLHEQEKSPKERVACCCNSSSASSRDEPTPDDKSPKGEL